MGGEDQDQALPFAVRNQSHTREKVAEEGVGVGQGAEGRGHDHRGQHEGDGHQGLEQALAGEVMAGQEPGPGRAAATVSRLDRAACQKVKKMTRG